jgi:hypothetical protein
MSLYSGQIVGVEGANTQYVLMTMARCTREYGLEVEEVGCSLTPLTYNTSRVFQVYVTFKRPPKPHYTLSCIAKACMSVGCLGTSRCLGRKYGTKGTAFESGSAFHDAYSRLLSDLGCICQKQAQRSMKCYAVYKTKCLP